MGKIKRPKTKKTQDAILEEHCEENLDVSLDSSKENVLHAVLDQLQSANVEEKYCGLQTLALFIENPLNLDEVLNSSVVKAAAPLLFDSAASVRNAAAGALRNLSANSFEACDAMIEKDVMTPLLAYFHEHTENWTPKEKFDEDSDTFVQCVNLLWNLCENSELAVKYLNESRILDILPKFLVMSTYSNDIVVAVLQCLFAVVEDNPHAIEKVKTNSENNLQQLLSIEGSEYVLLLIKTLAAGVVLNTCGGNITSLPTAVISKIMAILAQTLELDHRQVCHQLSSSVPVSIGNVKPKPPKGKEGIELEKKLKSFSQLLDAQQTSVEIIANLCSCQDNEDGNIDTDDSSDNEESIVDNVCNGDSVDMVTVLPEDKLPPEVLEAMTSLELFTKVWTKTRLPADNVMLILEEYESSSSLCKKLLNLQSRSLLCINNMLCSLPLENLGGVVGTYQIWVDAGKLVFTQSNSKGFHLLESATAVMRAALDRLKAEDKMIAGNSQLFSDLGLTDIEMLTNGIKECQEPVIRSNLIRMIGTLALLLVSNANAATADVVCAISVFILEQAHKESEAWVLAEAVDTLVDLYAEDETDALAAKIKLIEKLTILAPILKSKARQQRKTLKEHSVLVNTAIANLPRFIKYKQGRISKLKS